MDSFSSKRRAPFRTSALVGAGVAVGVTLLVPAPASAHFILEKPAAVMSQDSLGSPQKLGPCGDEGGGTATGTLTTYQPGETITVTIDEVIMHPGHYRVALAVNDPSELPPEPTVTPGDQACGTVPIESPAVYPVLADGMLVHTTAFTSPQSFQVTLPSNVTCTNCTLQVIEFMSEHPLNNPGGCFYHHCASIAIQAGASATDGGTVTQTDASAPGLADSGSGSSGGTTGGSGGTAGGSGSGGGTAGTSSAGDAGAASETSGSGSTGGCSVSVAARGASAMSALAGLLVLGIAKVRRRRRR